MNRPVRSSQLARGGFMVLRLASRRSRQRLAREGSSSADAAGSSSPRRREATGAGAATRCASRRGRSTELDRRSFGLCRDAPINPTGFGAGTMCAAARSSSPSDGCATHGRPKTQQNINSTPHATDVTHGRVPLREQGQSASDGCTIPPDHGDERVGHDPWSDTRPHAVLRSVAAHRPRGKRILLMRSTEGSCHS